MQTLVSFIFYLLAIAIVTIGLDTLRRLLWFLTFEKRPTTILELTPSSKNQTTFASTIEFFKLLHNFSGQNSWQTFVLGQRPIFTFEIVSTYANGIRFLVRLTNGNIAQFKRQLIATMPDIKIVESKDYLTSVIASQAHILEYHRTNSTTASLVPDTSNEAIKYFLGMMTKLELQEQISLQLVVSASWFPLRLHWQRLRRLTTQRATEPLFQVAVRTLVVSDNESRADDYQRGLRAVLASKYVVVPKQFWLRGYRQSYLWQSYRLRRPGLVSWRSCLLPASDLASLYHFPATLNVADELLIHHQDKDLPLAVTFRQRAVDEAYDILLGQHEAHGTTTAIGLTAAERERHVYILGGTGNGKSTMLEYAIQQDIEKGKGVAVIDPHGDLAQNLIARIPKKRLKDVIYFNPDDLNYPIGLNVLELSKGLQGNDLAREKEHITEAVISLFRKLFSNDDSGGHRIEYILRNTIQTALTVEGATLFTIYRLLNNPKFRFTVVDKLTNPDLKRFWNEELGKAGTFQRVKMSAGITAKIGRFLFSASAKRVFGQPVSTIDFDEVIDAGKILICNFSKGLLGEDTATLFGTSVMVKLQLAALRRARQPQLERRPYYLYIDELQNFATTSFVQLLSEARKYKLYLTVAEQSTAQQDRHLVEVMLANIGTIICFRTASKVDEDLLLPLFSPPLEQGDLAKLPSYHFYAKLTALEPLSPISGTTIVPTKQSNEHLATRVIDASRQRYAVAPDTPAVITSPLLEPIPKPTT